MDVEILNTQEKGRGVYAKYLIKEGETHTAEGIQIEKWQVENANTLQLYLFQSQFFLNSLLLFDWVSLLNDSKTPNLKYKPNGNQIIVTALRDIEPGEELTINYGYDIGEKAASVGIDLKSYNTNISNNK